MSTMVVEKAKHISKLTLDEFITDDFVLLAIITPLETYKLVYFINRALEVFLEKGRTDIEIKKGKNSHFYSHYFYDDIHTGTYWRLIDNVSHRSEYKPEGDSILFDDYTSSDLFLPEFKQVDVLLKIEEFEEQFDIAKLIHNIQQIKGVTTIYTIDNHTIKYKKNLFL